MSENEKLKKVIITRQMIGICHMSVCAEKDVTDEEILAVCNSENPSGTTNGWGKVIRNPDGSWAQSKNTAPVQCADHKNRMHFIVYC